METHKNTLDRVFSWLLIPLMLLLICVGLALSPMPEEIPVLSWGLALDLMVTVPLVYYLSIRKKNISKITVVPWIVGGILLSYHLLNQQNQPLSHYAFHYLLPLIELGIFSTIVYKSIKLIKEYRAQASGGDFLNAIHQSAQEVFGQGLPAKLLAWELAVIYYGLFKWKQEAIPNSFSYHKKAPIKSLLAVIMFLVVVETVVFHLLLQIWSVVAAWILTGLSLYSLLWLIAQWKSMAFRPITLNQHQLRLHHGMLFEAVVPLTNIEDYESIKSVGSEAKVLSLMPQMDSPNVQIKLIEPIEVQGIYGQSSTESVLAFKVDDPEGFCQTLGDRLA